jgi:site-specific DNA recombinase
LAPLAYLSPRIIEAIAEGQPPAGLTVTRLVRNLPTVWADQEKQLGFA